MHNDKKTAEEFVAHNVKQTPDHNSEKVNIMYVKFEIQSFSVSKLSHLQSRIFLSF